MVSHSRPLYRCVHSRMPEGEISLNPDAPPWGEAATFGSFILADGSDPALRQTEAKMVWDEWGIHLLYICHDPCIWGTFTNDQDPIFDEEVVEVFLAPHPEDEFYYEFEVSPRNVRFAAVINNPETYKGKKLIHRLLDCRKLRTQVQVEGILGGSASSDREWRAFLGIPYELLERDSPPVAGEVWRGNLYRIDRPAPDMPQSAFAKAMADTKSGLQDEFSCWSPTFTNPAAFHCPRHFGEIEFVQPSILACVGGR